jgi:predicted Zn-dependent protease
MFLSVAQIATGMFTPGLSPAATYGIGYGLQGINGVMDHLMDGAVEKYQKEADQLGAQYAWKAGFDPRGSLDFLDALEGSATAEFLPAKPALRLRLLNLFSEVEYLGPPANRVLDSAEFQQTRDRLRRR